MVKFNEIWVKEFMAFTVSDTVSVTSLVTTGLCPQCITPTNHITAWSKAGTVFVRSDARIVCSNHTQSIDVWCVYAFILCLGSRLATG
jgi:hypothetical protein